LPWFVICVRYGHLLSHPGAVPSGGAWCRAPPEWERPGRPARAGLDVV